MNLRLLFLPFSLVFFLGLSRPVSGQTDLKVADRLYDEMAFAQATEAYKKLLDKNEPSLEIIQRIAHGYRLMNVSKEAEFWYAQVLAFPGAASINTFFYAEAARRNGNYEKAKQLYLQYGNQVKSDQAMAMKLAYACDQAQYWTKNPQPVALTAETFNSTNSDFSPVFYKNGIVFTSDREKQEKGADNEIYAWTGKPYLQLYYLEKDKDKNWGKVQPLPEPVNSTYHNGAAVFSADGNTVFYTRTNKEKYKKKKVNTDPTSWANPPLKDAPVSRLEIYISQFKNNEWTKPKPFAYNKPREYSVGHPALSPNGNILYFASDMPGGFGETDLYYCTKEADGSWSKPVNCGNVVNTVGKECFPTLAPDGTLHFSSDGHLGMGGLDLFSAKGTKAKWQAVTNLETPFNSGGDDFGIIFDPEGKGETGYFSSNRGSESGTDDIYSFKSSRVPCTLAGLTVEQPEAKQAQTEGKPLSNVTLRLYRAGDTTALVSYSDKDGKFSFPIQGGVKYIVKGSKEGYLTKSVEVMPECQSVLDLAKLALTLNKNKVNSSYIVENIYYDLDKSEIRPDAARELDKLVVMLQDNPEVKIELSSHTDSRQTDHYNQMLSQLRADAAVKYIISRGIDYRRITAKGYGESQLRNRCKDGVNCSEDEHQLNRRTEFKLIK
ncbi:OmpA family protein [Adhaeribacter terreus]|uniref:OmpA family protein n=1 Tax=Adhaeribacter terreus TaxID=529703 RepID=A0ABW0ECT0_9BACT